MNDDRFDVLERFAPLLEAPEPAFEGFLRRRDRRRRNQRIAAGVIGIAVWAAAVWLIASGGPFDRTQTPASPGGAMTGPTVTGPVAPPPSNLLSRTVRGVPFSLRVPSRSWSPGPIERRSDGSGFRNGSLLISKSIVGPQGAEAVIFWTSFPDGDHADPCANLSSTAGASAADLAATVSTAPGTALVEGPSDVTVGGYPAKHVVLTVRDDLGCDPGFFYTWHSECWGPCWMTTNVGDTIEVWIVDVAGTRLFIEAETTTQADADLKHEIQQIVGSIRFGDAPTTFPGAPAVDYVLDLETGATTPLPDTILRSLSGGDASGQYAASPDGSALAYVAPGEDGTRQIFVADLDGSGGQQLTHDPVGAGWPAWSPDGSMIAYEGGAEGGSGYLRDLLVLDVATGRSTQIVNAVSIGSGVQFTPDGSALLYTGGSGSDPELRIVPISGGESTLLISPDEGLNDSGSGSLSPDGSLVTFLSSGFPVSGQPTFHCGPCRVVANADGTERRYVPGYEANPAGTWSPDGSRIVDVACRGIENAKNCAPPGGVIVVDVATGNASRILAFGIGAIWLDDHTLLIDL